ncbi:MAG: carbohydrate ABC transporter substrate-binding protein [Oscillospiraceae bacterium]|nr:carbohydrate ABC transporter substrate-binding protein [Oscillospiraceae bacterium]
MKKFLALMLALVMVLGLVACGEKAPADDGADAATGSVYWLNFKPESDEALQNIAKLYTDKTGVPVKVVTAASGTYNDTLTSEMDKDEAPTMFVVGNSAAVNTWGEFCYDLTGTDVFNELNTDAYILKDAEGKVCSIGYCYECYGIMVNKALLAEAGYAVEDITNFDALKAIVEDITARKDELGFAAFTAADMDGSSSWRFTGHVANLEYYWESVDAPEAWTACPAELTGAYMDNYRNLMELIFANGTVARTDLATGGHDATAEFKAGKAVFHPQGNWEWASLSEVFTADDLAMIPYYSGVAGEENVGLNCGTENYWAVNAMASEEDIKATLDFMYWLVTDAEASALAVGTFGVMPYTNAVASANPFLAMANDLAAAGKANMWWATNYQPDVDNYRAALVSALNDYNADPTDAKWEAVETAFVAGWATCYANVNG